MIKKFTKKSELEHFRKLSNEWWSESGKFKILHDIRPIRIKYVLNHLETKNLKGLEVLDLGCGGGLISEPFARLGCNVTGLDFVYENIKVAKIHAKENNLNINYKTVDLENIKLKKKYEVIIIYEVLEHLNNWRKLIKSLKKNLSPDGLIFISTINRNILSKIFAIDVAENLLKWIPKNTHEYEKFIKPEELEEVLKFEKFKIIDFTGLVFNPIMKNWKLSYKNTKINYFCCAKLT